MRAVLALRLRMTYAQWLPKPGRTCEQAERTVNARLQEKAGKELARNWPLVPGNCWRETRLFIHGLDAVKVGD